MVNAGRICCITAPFLLSIAVLICLVLVFLAGTRNHNSTLDDLYFLKLDLHNFTAGASANLLDAANTTELGGALEAAKQALGMTDYYTIYLRSYCSWNGNDTYANCTSPKSYFWFDPVSVWNLNSTGYNVDDFLDKSLQDGLKAYHAASKAIFILYSAGLATAALTLLVGISAIFSRWGSFFTTFCATLMTFVLLGASITATAMFLVLRTALNTALKDDYGITSSIGTRSLSLTWIGTAFAVAAGFFWTLSVCCCSGRSPYNYSGNKEARRTRAEKASYTYERVGSPYLGPTGGQSVPLQQYPPPPTQANIGRGREAAYEPFRPQGV